MKKRAVFLDRDGVINRVIVQDGKPYSPRKLRDFIFIDGIKNFLEKLKKAGFLLIVVTNQPDVARGLIRREELEKFHDLIRRELPINDIIVCPHDDGDNCECRKPKPGMILAAARKWDIDLESSFLIGDTWKDWEAARAAGCRFILIDAPYNRDLEVTLRAKGITAAEQMVLGSEK